MEDTGESIEKFLSDSPPTKQKLGLGSIVLLIGLVLFMTVIGWAYVDGSATQPTSGPALDFTLRTFDGESFRLSDHRGKVVVINFWASWCVPCRDEAPILQSVWERYRERGVILVGVTYLDSESASLDFIQEFGITYFNGPDIGTIISEEYRITGVPETFVVDQNGDVVEAIIAPITAGQLDRILERLLEP
ncbi:redoxin domain-containing protein [Phototrophicus methaneseepsis]|uniref:Redoxin domain-containing protein n=1 Tax=Phototrophicus methaneseepsis TaxID=2710758 RepID=A0A7S8EA00_9CHLR|nr:TlpA disulfide reductase family protein [Phototrophicus methaneseepsis]QPC83109.1 redoxin domain-containing protein [Phototrophicus methaneseepsis]